MSAMPNFAERLAELDADVRPFVRRKLEAARGNLLAAADALADLERAGINYRIAFPHGVDAGLADVRILEVRLVRNYPAQPTT